MARTSLPIRRESWFPTRRWFDESPFSALQRAMDDMMGTFGMDPWARRDGFELTPRVDVTEEPEAYHVSAELPGVKKDDVQVTLHEDVLTIRGEKKEEREEKKKDYYQAERSYGSFSRSIRLPGDVQADKIHASFKDGVLDVQLPKSKEGRVEKRIEVQG